MTTRAERDITLLVVGIGAMAFALVTGLTTAAGTPDWVGIVTICAGVTVMLIGVIDMFRHRAD